MSAVTLFQILAIKDIDLDDTTYLLRPEPPKHPGSQLVESIAEFGILQPPLLYHQDHGPAIVLSGRQRIAAAILLGLDRIPALLVPAATPPSRRLELLVEHARMGSEPSVIEQAILLQKAAAWLSEQELLHLLGHMGHPSRPHVLRELTSLLALDGSAIMALHHQKLHQKAARKLARLKAEDQQELVRRITDLRLGGSRQQQLVTLATELRMRRNRPLREIFAEMEKERGGRSQGKEETPNIPQQAAALLRWLHRQCFPRSDAAEAEFRRFCRRLELPATMRLHHTPAFEDDRLILEIEFQHRQELEQQWPEIKKILTAPGRKGC